MVNVDHLDWISTVDVYCFILMDLCDSVRSVGKGFHTAVFIGIRVDEDIIIGCGEHALLIHVVGLDW